MSIRRLHQWAALLVAIPAVWIITSGIALHFRGQIEWLQPSVRAGSRPGAMPTVTMDRVVLSVRSLPLAQIGSWSDVASMDIVPRAGVMRLRSKSGYEVHVDSSTGEILNHGPRRVAQIFSFHEGNFFGAWAPLWLFVPSGILLLVAWFTGVVMGLRILSAKARNRRKHEV